MPRTPACVLPLFLGLAAATCAAAADEYDGRTNQLHVAVPRIDTQLKVDGRLDESAWQQAATLVGSQYAPADAMAPRERRTIDRLRAEHAHIDGWCGPRHPAVGVDLGYPGDHTPGRATTCACDPGASETTWHARC